jgi:hypothetical protein
MGRLQVEFESRRGRRIRETARGQSTRRGNGQGQNWRLLRHGGRSVQGMPSASDGSDGGDYGSARAGWSFSFFFFSSSSFLIFF